MVDALAMSCAAAGGLRTRCRAAATHGADQPTPTASTAAVDDYYGTTEPFAEHAVYFVLTDRFVNGDPTNDQRDAGRRASAPSTARRRRAGRAQRQHRLPRRRLQRPARQRRLHPRHGLRRGLDHADRRQPRRGLHRRRSGEVGRHVHRPRQDRLPRLLGRELLQARRAPAERGPRLRRLDHGPEAAWPEDRARHRLQPRLAVVHDAGRPAEVRRDLRQATAS